MIFLQSLCCLLGLWSPTPRKRGPRRNWGLVSRNSENSLCLWEIEIEIVSLGNKSLASILWRGYLLVFSLWNTKSVTLGDKLGFVINALPLETHLHYHSRYLSSEVEIELVVDGTDGDDIGDERFTILNKLCFLSWLYINKGVFSATEELTHNLVGQTIVEIICGRDVHRRKDVQHGVGIVMQKKRGTMRRFGSSGQKVIRSRQSSQASGQWAAPHPWTGGLPLRWFPYLYGNESQVNRGKNPTTGLRVISERLGSI